MILYVKREGYDALSILLLFRRPASRLMTSLPARAPHSPRTSASRAGLHLIVLDYPPKGDKTIREDSYKASGFTEIAAWLEASARSRERPVKIRLGGSLAAAPGE